ncbi:hypothetical protein F5Y14DRAFT_436631 [Nemania sp. NC0429]|nr:hypothetical protein F5Y14DRAFT_436631 [Nemania sp. NC0429]
MSVYPRLFDMPRTASVSGNRTIANNRNRRRTPSKLDFPPAWTRETDIHAVRAVFAGIAAADTPPAHIAEEDRVVYTRDGANITVRIYRLRSRPPKSDGGEGCPGMVMLHGGGFCVGGLERLSAEPPIRRAHWWSGYQRGV